jgi:pimeloyl-ACP methyl ester carboxylesterase
VEIDHGVKLYHDPMPHTAVDDRTVAFEVHGPPPGEADAILLLHGLGSCCADWNPQTVTFEKTYTVVAVDLAGHGASSACHGLPTVEAMAMDVVAVLEVLGIRAVHVIGLSLGGCVALALALHAPVRVRSLVLVNTFARLTPTGPRAATRMLCRAGLLLGAPMATVGAYVARELFPEPDQTALRAAAASRLTANGRRAYLAALTALVRFDARQRLGAIRCPTLVVAGERDTTIALAAKQALARGIPGARLEVVPHSGHVTNLDQAAEFNRIVEGFLRDR